MPVTQPDAPFLFAPEPGTTLTYAGLRVTAQALCAELAALGVRPGEVVSYMLPNGVAAASVFLGAMYGGYVVSPISLLAQDSLVEHTLAHSETRVVYAAPEFVERLSAIIARIGSRADRSAHLARRAAAAVDLRYAAGRHARRRNAGDADVHVGHDRHAEGRAAVARQSDARRAVRHRRRTR